MGPRPKLVGIIDLKHSQYRVISGDKNGHVIRILRQETRRGQWRLQSQPPNAGTGLESGRESFSDQNIEERGKWAPLENSSMQVEKFRQMAIDNNRTLNARVQGLDPFTE